MSKKTEPEKDWQYEAKYYEEEYYKCMEELNSLKEFSAKQSERINNLQETIFVLTSIIQEKK